MMNVEEIEVKIKEEKANLAKLEQNYEKEEDESKITKLEFSMMRKEEAIEKLIDRQQKLLEREERDAEKDNGKDKNAEEDEDICPECGGNLMQVGEDSDDIAIFECEKCGELFLDE